MSLDHEMGLLTALDFHKSGMAGDCIEVEYRLYSWGEIYPPFIGDREHSTAARYILREFPFKLFSSSTPYNVLPQKVCLTFKAPYEIKKDTETLQSSGIFPEEIAKEVAAFLSLVTRRRIFIGKQMRYNGLPIEQEVDLYPQAHLHFHERQRLKEIEPKEIYQLLENLQAMDRRIANGFILAIRLYHSAIEMMYTEPEFSYVFLVMSLEAISSIVYKKGDVMPSDAGDDCTELEEFLDSKYPGWRKLYDMSTSMSRKQVIDMLLTKEYFNFRKFSKFAIENAPERFWFETEDDAKPDYLTGIIDSQGRELISNSDITIRDWEKIEKESLRRVLRNIYNARSKLVHEGIRLPASIIIGHFRRIPIEAMFETIDTSQKNLTKYILQIPPLITFERLVSYSMVEFLRKHQEGVQARSMSENRQ